LAPAAFNTKVKPGDHLTSSVIYGGIAFTGGCTDTNEFNYLVVKSMRSLGVCYLENQARV